MIYMNFWNLNFITISKSNMEVKCSHILQKHKGSRNPVDSYRNKPVTRSLEEARENIKKFRAQIDGNPKIFGELAAQYS